MSAEKLAKLSDDELFAYFGRHAKYYKGMPPDSRYAICIGCTSLFSDDTKTLFEKFKAAIRNVISQDRLGR